MGVCGSQPLVCNILSQVFVKNADSRPSPTAKGLPGAREPVSSAGGSGQQSEEHLSE